MIGFFPLRSVGTQPADVVTNTQPAGLFFRTVTDGAGSLAQQNSTLGPDGIIYSGSTLGKGQSNVSTQLTVSESSWWSLRGEGATTSTEISTFVRDLSDGSVWGVLNQDSSLNVDEQVYLRAGQSYELAIWVRNGNGSLEASFSEGEGFLAGDYNGDGFVSQGDLDLVLLNWGSSAAPDGWLAVDQFDGGDEGGLMSQNELDGVLLNWGSGTPADIVASVPEPTLGVSLVVLACGCAGRRSSAGTARVADADVPV